MQSPAFRIRFSSLGIEVYSWNDRDRKNIELRQWHEDLQREFDQTQELILIPQETTEQPDTEDGAP